MLPSRLIPSTTICSIVLCSIISHEQAGTQQDRLYGGRSFDRLSVLLLGPSSALVKPRVTLHPYLMSPEWVVDHHDFTCILPIDTAAAVMIDFYEEVAAFAATTLTPVSLRYQIWFGQIMLEIISPPGVIVNWIFVQQFALGMLDSVKRGYVNTYLVNFIHRPSGAMVTFSLYTGLLRAMSGGRS